jgi:hypothetical protein
MVMRSKDRAVVIRVIFFSPMSSSSTAGMEARIQTGALPAVGWSVLCVPSMGAVLMGFKSPV